MGALATCNALETATGVGRTAVAALAILCALEVAVMAALGAHAAAAGTALAMICSLDASAVAGASKVSSADAGASEASRVRRLQ